MPVASPVQEDESVSRQGLMMQVLLPRYHSQLSKASQVGASDHWQGLRSHLVVVEFQRQPVSEIQTSMLGLMQRRSPQVVVAEYHSQAGSALQSPRAPYRYAHRSMQMVETLVV